MAELLIYNSPLDNAQISNLEYYLNQKWGLGFSIDPSPMIILGKGKVVDDYGEGNNLAFATTKKMYRAVTRGDTLLAWWPFDDDDLSSNLVTGKTDNQRTADLFDGAVVTELGKFGRGLSFDKFNSKSR